MSEAHEGNLSGNFRLLKCKKTTEAQNKTTKHIHRAKSINYQGKETYDKEKSD